MTKIDVSRNTLIVFSITIAIFIFGAIVTFAFMISTNVSTSGGKSGPSGPRGLKGDPGICNLTDPNSSSPISVGNIQIENIYMGSSTTNNNNDNQGNIFFQNNSQKIQGTENCLLIYSSNGICIDSPRIGTKYSNQISPWDFDPNNLSSSIFYISSQICFTPNCSLGIGPSLNSTTLKLYGFEDTNANIKFPLYVNLDGIIDGSSNQFKLIAKNNGILIDTNGYGISSNNLIFNDTLFLMNNLWLAKDYGFHITNPATYPFFINNISTTKLLSIYFIQNTQPLQLTMLKDEYNTFNYFLLTFPNNVSIIQSLENSILLQSLDYVVVSGRKSVHIITNDTLHLGSRYINILNNSFMTSDLSFRGYQRKISFFRNGIINSNLNLSGPPFSTSFASIEANDNDLYCPLFLRPSICTLKLNVSNEFNINNVKFAFNSTGSSQGGPALMIQQSSISGSSSPIEIVANSAYFQNITTNTFTVLGYTQFPNGLLANGFILQSGGVISGLTSMTNVVVSTQLSSSGSTTFTGTSTTIKTTKTDIQSQINFGIGTTANCSSPIFFTSANSQYPCLPDCLDFYNCTILNSIRFKARNGLLVATDATQFYSNLSSLDSNVTFGTSIDYINSNYSILSNITMQTNSYKLFVGINGSQEAYLGPKNIRTLNSYSTNYVKKKLNSGSFGELNSLTALPSSSCLPYMTLTKVDSSTFTLPPPFFNYSASTCSEVSELYDISNISITKDGNVLMGSLHLKRTCSSSNNNAFCSPFFEWFINDIFLKELLLTNYSFTSKVFIRPTGPFAFSSDDIFSIRSKYINIVTTHALSSSSPFQNSSIQNLLLGLINQNFSMSNTFVGNVEKYEILNYSFIILNSTTGITSISASNAIDLNEGDVVIQTNNDIKIKGNILDSLGAVHPCCSTSNSGLTAGNFTTITIANTALTSGATPSQLNYFEQTTFSMSFTTLASGTIAGVTVWRTNNLVNIYFPQTTVTTTGTGVAIEASTIPTRFYSATNGCTVSSTILDHGGIRMTMAQVTNSGIIRFYCGMNVTTQLNCITGTSVTIYSTMLLCKL